MSRPPYHSPLFANLLPLPLITAPYTTQALKHEEAGPSIPLKPPPPPASVSALRQWMNITALILSPLSGVAALLSSGTW